MKKVLKNCVYKLENTINGKVYIGQAICFKNRIIAHKHDSKKNQTPLYKSIRKHGWDNFKKDVLMCNLTQDEMNDFEVYFINRFNSQDRKFGYNLESGGKNGNIPNDKIKRMFSKDQELEIIELYKSEISAKSIAKSKKCDPSVILGILKRNKINIRYSNKFDKKIEKEISEKYKNGTSSSDLSKEYNIAKKTILHIVKKFNVKIKGNQKRLTLDIKNKIIEDYKLFKSTYKVGEKYNISAPAVYNIVKKAGVKLSKYKIPLEQHIDVISKYKKGMSINKLAEEYMVNRHTISSIIKEFK